MSIDCLQSSKECSHLFIMTVVFFRGDEAQGGLVELASSSTSLLMND